MSIDRLSALPDGVLIHILSFLGVQKSAVTSALSKRWRFIWTELPILEFKNYSRESEKIRKFVAKVNRTLLIRSRGIQLEKFSVCFRYNGSFASDVDSWIGFVLKNKVKEVGLSMHSTVTAVEELYGLPEMMYSNSSLTQFSVRGCLMDTLTTIEWQSLTCLYINNSELSQRVIESILSGCPVLHTLDLEECWGFNCLDVKSQNLYTLTVKYREDGDNGPLLEISAPYVHTLDISFNPEERKLVLRNIKSLVSAEINFTDFWSSFVVEEVVISTTKELFEIFKDVKELELGQDYFKVCIDALSFFNILVLCRFGFALVCSLCLQCFLNKSFA
ncbi:putative F-box/LRR-repeat protein at3g18150 [Phtheirospermum japonicum]|uniref:Putative F-box/LRR-repeat protein at3g18150 n=1 Tax=Phtheirospermum japonicum TaxID=374723 RepID=A0A830BJU8_9LAMI|nr:putative F-box/LRR-repeat protein at3g18150 [Phtheirospermum japonicum]